MRQNRIHDLEAILDRLNVFYEENKKHYLIEELENILIDLQEFINEESYDQSKI